MGKKKKIIWFLNQNSYMPEDGPHIRHYTFGKYLARRGYEPFVFAANELHHSGMRIDTGDKKYIEKISEGVHFFYVKTFHYEKNDYKRILNIISYYKILFRICEEAAKKYGKPDVIYASNMYPTALVAGIKMAKKYGVKCICENRDLIPEGFVTKGTFKKTGVLSKILTKWMQGIYYKADALVFTMSGGAQYIRDHKWDKEHGGKVDMERVYYINNGVDLEVSRENAVNYVVPDEHLDSPDCFKVVYFGAIRFLNKMPLFVETAKELKKRGYNNIKILMWGNGTKLDEMRRQLAEYHLDNIVLKGYVEKKYIPGIAKRADLFIGTGNSCCVGEYGMSFNKLFDYLAAGKPTILPFKVAESIIEANGAGIELDMADASQLTDAIIKYYEMEKETYKKYCDNAIAISKQFDYALLSRKVENIIENI